MRLHAGFATVVWMLVAWAQLVALSNASKPVATASKAAVRESFKFDRDDRLVLIPAHVGTKDYQFVLDTGSTWSVFDVSLRSHLGPRVSSTQAGIAQGGDVKIELYSPPNAQVGSLPLTKAPVVCHDFTALRQASGRGIHGIVGMDFLKNWIITIDFDEGRVGVLLPGTDREPNWGESVPFVYDTKGGMFILATVGENVRSAFAVDTGYTGTGSIEGSLLNRLVSSHEARVTGDEEGVDYSGVRSCRGVKVASLSFGPFRHENLRFTSGNRNALGLNYLSRYRVTIDFPNERLYLAKGKHFADPDRGRTCGIGLLSKQGRLEVVHGRLEVVSVDERGPAYAAGLRAKDLIVELCGKPVSAWKQSEVDRLFKTEGKAVQMTIERDGKRIEKSFTPKEYD